jgi:hypothetical protein
MHQVIQVYLIQLEESFPLCRIDDLRFFGVSPAKIASFTVENHPGIAPIRGLGHLSSGIG